MCGIFGVVTKSTSDKVVQNNVKSVISDLLKMSQSRGKDASGIAVSSKNKIQVLKKDVNIVNLSKSIEFNNILLQANFKSELEKSDFFGLIGHSRMVTNGSNHNHDNQPVIKSNKVVVHNGIIVNDTDLWVKYPFLKREYEVDTEILAALLDHFEREEVSIERSISKVYEEIKGAASIAVLNTTNNLIYLASNTGSLFVAENPKLGLVVFASEEQMITESCVKRGLIEPNSIVQINKNNFALINMQASQVTYYDPLHIIDKITKGSDVLISKTIEDLSEQKIVNTKTPYTPSTDNLKLEKLLVNREDEFKKIKRCTKCLIPTTFPGIYFNDQGVCSMCTNWTPIAYKGKNELDKLLLKHKTNSSKQDVLLPLSGGRDSCYALHYLKKEMGMNPVTYTYDWGMITDLARRNISRMTSELGVEHILISADIKQKREFIKKNVNAWLKRPSLGTIPLFMAGDKQFFYYANQLKKQFKLDLLIFGMNPLERTDFKVAFAGVKENSKENRHYHLSLFNKLNILKYYGKEFLLNPAYFNSSLIDTFDAFLSYYFIPHDYQIFFEYFPWNEELINKTIIDNYDWEISPDTPTTWRIGDGTAAFYNYIYYTIAGFTENDTFRSNQIRQGLISREEAMKCVINENKPRYESIKWYCDTIGIDFESTIKKINQIKPLYRVE